ncbi:hypothetical protein VPH35_026981 [Triticum aestivum]|uniref:Uncharacterized protein n=1 Tax=Triticum turgidum subsp. durum TaxID=4567 RepID=A0A9R1RI69_TRITD|nr:unnamed protein product [Triticum turgidum subsp. durum]
MQAAVSDLIGYQHSRLKRKRPMLVFGFNDASHGHAEIASDNLRVPFMNILHGEGHGFELTEGRLGPGRSHHCLRLRVAAECGTHMMVERALRTAFGKKIAQHGSFQLDWQWSAYIKERKLGSDHLEQTCVPRDRRIHAAAAVMFGIGYNSDGSAYIKTNPGSDHREQT